MAVTPFMIDLANKRVVIVGGGRVAVRRIRYLLASGACMTVISPELSKEVRSLWKSGIFYWKQKIVEADDLTGAFLIIVATNDATVNQAVIEAAPKTALINVVTDAEQGDVQFPAHLQQGKLSISIATNGASPMLAGEIKRQLAAMYDQNYREYVDFLDACRKLIKRLLLTKPAQKQLLRELLDERFLNKQKQVFMMEWLKSLERIEKHAELLRWKTDQK
ncbi:NAD(P)-binding protein [Lentibacillus sp. N15]|uniref:NAD(P)-binding protein n=1 Tax=Lentibacillus songyuanensis TaxID=3136161 RepID=UPI0031BBA3FB